MRGLEEGPQGVLVLRGEGDLLAVSPEEVRAAFKRSGALWLRGFEVGPRAFLDFIQQFARELVTLNSYERVRHPQVHELQAVTGGMQALRLHTEMGHLPHRPHFLSFWCESPGRGGGETLLVDGVALWKALRPETQRLFLEKPVRYMTMVPEAWWTDRVQSKDPAVVQRAFADQPGVQVHLEPDGVLLIEWRTPAVFQPRYARELGLAASLFPWVVPDLAIRFVDGSAIPEEVMAELEEKSQALAAEIAWAPGEVLFFDNTRWLHGRREVHSFSRKVHMLQGYLSFE